MNHSFLTAGAALLLLGGFAVASPAQAVSPLSLKDTATLVIPAGDEENAEIYHDLQTGITPPKAMVGDDAIGEQDSATEHPKAEGESEGAAKGNGDIEQKELQEDGLLPK